MQAHTNHRSKYSGSWHAFPDDMPQLPHVVPSQPEPATMQTPTHRTIEPRIERAYQCVACHARSSFTPRTHYVTFLRSRTTNKLKSPTHCAYCANPAAAREHDYIDFVSLRYDCPRNLAREILYHLSTVNAHRSIKHPIDLDTFVQTKLGLTCMHTSKSNGFSPSIVTCQSCQSSYSIVRTHPTAKSTPMYCIWCASPNVTTRQVTTDEAHALWLDSDTTQMQALAVNYNLPSSLITALYTDWSQMQQFTFFSEYLQSPSVTKIINAYHALTQPTVPSTD